MFCCTILRNEMKSLVKDDGLLYDFDICFDIAFKELNFRLEIAHLSNYW